MQTSEAPVFWGYTKLRIARFLYGLKYCISQFDSKTKTNL